MKRTDADILTRCVGQALDGVHREYPNLMALRLRGDEDLGLPRDLTPAFYGCFDWHSAVHSHWAVARGLRLMPGAAFAGRAADALSESLTPEKIEAERIYLEPRPSFEMPYGVAWLLTLNAELRGHPHPDAGAWRDALAPLASMASERIASWLGRLPGPIRTGEHNQTALSMGLALDAARANGDDSLEGAVIEAAQRFYGEDRDAPISWEPSAHDFLSPALAEADLMRRVLEPGAFSDWLADFLPGLASAAEDWLAPCDVPEEADGRLTHRAGLNLSRAWMLMGIAGALSSGDPRRGPLDGAAALHREAGLRDALTDHWEGAHWLGSFAVYLLGGGAGPATR